MSMWDLHWIPKQRRMLGGKFRFQLARVALVNTMVLTTAPVATYNADQRKLGEAYGNFTGC